MTGEPTNPLRQMRVVDVPRVRPDDETGRNVYSGAHVVVLEELEGGRILPIWVGPSDGS